MKVENVLNAKGHQVETVSPQEGVAGAIHRLVNDVIGALVVSSDGQRHTSVESVFGKKEEEEAMVGGVPQTPAA
jgi:hypothetical protein